MFLSPVDNLKQCPDKRAWANYVIYEDRRFIALFGTGRKTIENPGAYPTGLDIAESKDGIHWEWIVRDVVPIIGAHAGFGICKIKDYYYYYPTCSNPEQGVHFKIYRTKDFHDWEYLGKDYDVSPDREYYAERWDELHIMKDTDTDGCIVYYGYISSETKSDVGEPGAGMLKSYDGINWDVLLPLKIEWGEIPSQHMELNFVEKIDGLYYLSMSGRMYMDSYGYSLYTFIGETPFGPFYPDREMFRLSGTTRREVTWLGHSVKTPDGFLSALWLSHNIKQDIPSTTFALGSLKKLITDNTHLRFKYWEGTDAVKGEETTVSFLQTIHPEYRRMIVNEKITADRDGVIAVINGKCNKETGFIFEGLFTAFERRGHIATHQHAASVGFYFEETAGKGVAIIADTLGVTRTGKLEYGNTKITSDDPYAFAGYGLVQSRSGEFKGTAFFDYEDTVGPFGHASYCGIRHGKKHSFRLLARGDYFELFIDDFYVQTYLLPEKSNGITGLCVFDGICIFENIRMYEMK